MAWKVVLLLLLLLLLLFFWGGGSISTGKTVKDHRQDNQSLLDTKANYLLDTGQTCYCSSHPQSDFKFQ